MNSKRKPHYIFLWVKLLLIACFAVLVFLAPALLVVKSGYGEELHNLTELQQYAATLDEWIKMEGESLEFPEYDEYYKSISEKSILSKAKDKLLHCLGLKKLIFSPFTFKKILTSVTEARLQRKWHGDFVQKIEAVKDTCIVIPGVVQGAFHSLVRTLGELKKLGFIDENFKILKNDGFLIFLGNVINRSPYTLEILTTVLKLMEVNPDKVIYLRGGHEYFEQWKNHTLRRELELRLGMLKTEGKIPLQDQVSTFFGTLPLALYCVDRNKNTEIECFRISPLIENEKVYQAVEEVIDSSFLRIKGVNKLETLQLDYKKATNSPNAEQKIRLKAIITGIKKRFSYERMDGLLLLPPVNGVAAWTIFSAPTETFRRSSDFFYDVFAWLVPAVDSTDWVMTLYNRDIRNEGLDYQKRSVYLFSAKQAH